MKFIIVLLTFAVGFLLTGCDTGIETSKYESVIKQDKDFSDCIVKKVSYEGSMIIIARCPNSVTSVDFPYGNSRANSITVEAEVEYAKKLAAEHARQKALIEEQERKAAIGKLTTREIELLGIK